MLKNKCLIELVTSANNREYRKHYPKHGCFFFNCGGCIMEVLFAPYHGKTEVVAVANNEQSLEYQFAEYLLTSPRGRVAIEWAPVGKNRKAAGRDFALYRFAFVLTLQSGEEERVPFVSYSVAYADAKRSARAQAHRAGLYADAKLVTIHQL